VRLRKHAEGIEADFAGTACQQPAPINCTFACLRAAVIGSIIAAIDPDLPLNAGLTELVDVRAPLGSMVNPTYPAPTFGTTADPAARAMETVLRALGQLVPDLVAAGSYSTGQNATGGGTTAGGEEFLWYSYQAGGCGAWAGGDGNSAEWHLMANSKNESMEAWEARYPVEHLSHRLVPDSGGAGRWRGGLAVERSWRVLAQTRLSGIADHHEIAPHGLFGGQAGAPNAFALIRGGVRRSLQAWFGLLSPSKFANLALDAGDVFVTVQGGGGGYGEPADRDPAALAADLRGGYVSTEAAQRLYGRRSP
jgi:N-methylhydantoinase B